MDINTRNVKTFAGVMEELRKVRSFMQERGLSYDDAHEAAFEAYALGLARMERIVRDSADS